MLSRPFFTIQEISELLKISEVTVRGWVHQRELRAVRFGREFRVAAKDLEAFVDAHVLEPAPPRKGSPVK